MYLFLLLTLTVSIAGYSPTETVKLNGKIEPQEWNDATEHQVAPGCKVLLKKADDVLYVALINEQKIWTHLYLSNGELVKVMHASAALGDARYTKNQKTWHTGDSFQYEMRDTVYNDQLVAKMNTYYENHGWVANNGNTGNGQIIEAKINLRQWKKDVYFACVMSDYNMNFTYYPATLNDDTVLPKLVQGTTPDALKFEPLQWSKIK